MKKPLEISYAFTRDGVAAFLEYALADTFHAIESGETVPDIEISIGSRTITVPMLPETYEALEKFLPEAEKIYHEEYEEETQC